MEDLSLFAKNLKQARTDNSLTQAALADAIEVSVQTISAYEKAGEIGKGKNPTLENAIKIARALNVSLDWLCGIETQIESKTKHQTLGDVARSVIDLSQITGVSLESIVRKEMYIEPDYEYPSNIDRTRPALVFGEGELEKFINELQKVSEVCNSVDMGEELYQPWLESRLAALDKKATTENSATNPVFDEKMPWE